MSLAGDLYSSLDGFVHRNVDRIGRRLDRSGSDARSRVALLAVVSSFVPYTLAMLTTGDQSPGLNMTYGLYAGLESRLAFDEVRHGPNETQRGSERIVRERGSYDLDCALRTVRLTPALIGTGAAVFGAVTLVESAMRASPDMSSVTTLAWGSALLGPAFASYLRDRDPPAPESDPMLAYLPEPAKPALEP